MNIVKPVLLNIKPITLSHQAHVVQTISSWFSTPDYVHTITANKAKELIAAVYGFKHQTSLKISIDPSSSDQELELSLPDTSPTDIYLNLFNQIKKVSSGKYSPLLAYILADYFVGLFEGRWDDFEIIQSPSLLLINMIDRFPKSSYWGDTPCTLFFTLNNVGHFMTRKSYCRTKHTDLYMDALNEIANSKTTFLQAIEFHQPRFERLKFPKLHKTYNYVFLDDGEITHNNLANTHLKPLLAPRRKKINDKQAFINDFIIKLPYHALADENGIYEHVKSLDFLQSAKVQHINTRSAFLNNIFGFMTRFNIHDLESKFHFNHYGLQTLISAEIADVQILGQIELPSFGLCDFELFYSFDHAVKTSISEDGSTLFELCYLPQEKPKKVKTRLTISNNEQVIYRNTPENKLQTYAYHNSLVAAQEAAIKNSAANLIHFLHDRTKNQLIEYSSVMTCLINSISELYLRKQILFSDDYLLANNNFVAKYTNKAVDDQPVVVKKSSIPLPSKKYFPQKTITIDNKVSPPSFKEFLHHITLLHEVRFTLFKNQHVYIFKGDRLNATLQQLHQFLDDHDRFIPVKQYSDQELEQINLFLNKIVGTEINVKKSMLDPKIGKIEVVRKKAANSKARKFIKSQKAKEASKRAPKKSQIVN